MVQKDGDSSVTNSIEMQLNENVTVVTANEHDQSASYPPPPFVASDSIDLVEELEEDDSALVTNPVEDELEVVNIEEYPDDNVPAIMVTDYGNTNVVRRIFRCCFKCRIVAAALSLPKKTVLQMNLPSLLHDFIFHLCNLLLLFLNFKTLSERRCQRSF